MTYKKLFYNAPDEDRGTGCHGSPPFWKCTFTTEAFLKFSLCIIVEDIQEFVDISISIIFSKVLPNYVLINWNLKRNCSSFEISEVFFIWIFIISVVSVSRFRWITETYLSQKKMYVCGYPNIPAKKYWP